jgi:hypothetical protein
MLGGLVVSSASDDRFDDSVDVATVYGSCFDLHILDL